MEYRKLGKSEVKVSAITLGAWAIGGFMWGGADDENAVAAIRKSIDLGVTSIDTAPVYGMGHSEEIVGQAVAGRRDKVQILTKYSLHWDGRGVGRFSTPDPSGKMVTITRSARYEDVLQECERSLKRLGTDYVDLYQQHWPVPEIPIEETLKAVDKLLKDGKIRAFGVSNFPLELLKQARHIVPVASVQPPYSMINRGIDQDLLPYCRDNNVGVVVYSPLQRGLLTGKVTLDREFPETDHRHDNPYFTRENRKRVLEFLEKIRPIADRHNATLAQLVINWTIHRPGITAALVGARNARQAEENAGAADFKLTQQETDRINDLLKDVQLAL